MSSHVDTTIAADALVLRDITLTLSQMHAFTLVVNIAKVCSLNL